MKKICSLVILTVLSCMILACGKENENKEEDKNQMVDLESSNDKEEVQEFSVPTGDGEFQPEYGTGEYFEIPSLTKPEESERTIYRLSMDISSEANLKKWENIISLESVERYQVYYRAANTLLEFYLDELNQDYFDYWKQMGEAGYPYSYFVIKDGDKEKYRFDVEVYTYEACDETILYHCLKSENAMDRKDYYTGDSPLKYKSGDSLKIVLDYTVPWTGEIKEINYKVTIDEYGSEPLWFLNKPDSTGKLYLLVPYDRFMEMFSGESLPGELSYYEEQLVVKCKEGYQEGFEEELENIMGTSGSVLSTYFFE